MADPDNNDNLQETVEIDTAQQTQSAIEAQRFYETLKESNEAENLQDAILAALKANNNND